jgi:RNA polymerase sigma factor (sigma-70 family)
LQRQVIQERTVAEIINGLIIKDDESWREFLLQIGPMLKGICFRAGLNDDETDDIVQNFTLRLLENNCRILRSYEVKDRDSFFRWVKVIISRLVLDYVRLTDLKTDREMESGENHWRETEFKSLDGDWNTTRLMLESLTDQLSTGEKVLFWLEYSDLDNSEVATILGISLEAVQKRLSRLRTKLKAMLEGKK